MQSITEPIEATPLDIRLIVCSVQTRFDWEEDCANATGPGVVARIFT